MMRTLLILAVLFIACTGPRGPVGPQGEPGVVDTASTRYYFEYNGILADPVDTNGISYWDLTISAPLKTPAYSDYIIMVDVKPDSASLWHEPEWYISVLTDGIWVRIITGTDCQQGYMYRISVVWW